MRPARIGVSLLRVQTPDLGVLELDHLDRDAAFVEEQAGLIAPVACSDVAASALSLVSGNLFLLDRLCGHRCQAHHLAQVNLLGGGFELYLITQYSCGFSGVFGVPVAIFFCLHDQPLEHEL